VYTPAAGARANRPAADKVTYNDQGQLHSYDDEPSRVVIDQVHSSRRREWHRNGALHRDDDRPAVEVMNMYGEEYVQGWYQHGVAHRVDGPALLVGYTGIAQEHYYLFGGKVTRRQWLGFRLGVDLRNTEALDLLGTERDLARLEADSPEVMMALALHNNPSRSRARG
jgi:hypothetical protein